MFNFIFPKFHFNVERWKWNKEFKIYVSNFGHFKDKYKNNIPVKIKQNGYCQIKTEYGYKLVHRLVMLTFKPIPNAEELTVDHLDHNKRNNRVDNLEWVSDRENFKRANNDYVSLFEEIEDKNQIINGLGMRFDSYESAANWLIKNYMIKDKAPIPSTNKIIKKIKKAIISNEPYCHII